MPSAHTRIALLTLGLCSAPYLGLRVYLNRVMHGSSLEAAVPGGFVLGALFLLGVVVPTAGVFWTVREVVRDGLQFRLSGLLVAYAALVALFASSYAIVQASGVESSFAGMSTLWSAHDPATLDVHLDRLHAIFFESLYLSVMTITTVGYGDLAPLTPLGKLLAAIQGLVGIGYVGVALGHYFSVCIHRRETGDAREPDQK